MLNPSPALLFAGPSLTPEARKLIQEAGIALQAPVQRGDINASLEKGFQGAFILVDGVFDQVAAVGHREIRRAIECNCRVFGLSSMGAIRAFEMRDLGMEGYGRVFGRFFSMEDFQDDELALLHEDSYPFRSLSEPLVHFRECLEDLEKSGKISPEQAQEVLNDLKGRYFGQRSMERFQQLLEQVTERPWRSLCPDFEPYRVKSRDLENFLRQQIWLKEKHTA